MTISTISKTVPAYTGGIPNRGDIDNFETDVDTSLTYQANLPTDLNELTTQINTTIGQMNTDIAQVNTDATTATAQADLAEEWATSNALVESLDYSAKEYAIGTVVPAGSAKDWASQTGATVDGSEYSAKEYATGTTVAVGSAKDWATSLTEVADGLKGSRGYVAEAQTLRDETASIVASIPVGQITTGDDFETLGYAWDHIRAAYESGALPWKPLYSLNFAKDDYQEYVGLAVGFRKAPLVDLATFTRVGNATGVNLFGQVETVSTDQPRVVFEQGKAKGILLEGSGTNLITNSESGTGIRTVENPDSGVSPAGDTTADFFAPDTTSGEHYTDKSATVTAGLTYRFSFYVKKDSANTVYDKIMIRFDGVVAVSRIFNFTTETFSTSTDTTVTKVGSYYRISLSVTPTASGNLVCRTQFLNELGDTLFAGDGVSGFYVWGRQLEQSATPSSYIKTTASPVVRNADDFELDVSNLPSKNWSVFIEFDVALDTSGGKVIWSMTGAGGGFANSLYLEKIASNSIVLSSGSGVSGNIGLGAYTGGKVKVFVSYNNGVLKAVRNGGSLLQDTSVNELAYTTATLGKASWANSNYITGTISKFELIPSAVSDIEMQALTGV